MSISTFAISTLAISTVPTEELPPEVEEVVTKGGMSLTEEEYYKLERKQIREQQRLRMIALDDDEILSII